jgi:hypothetical protein
MKRIAVVVGIVLAWVVGGTIVGMILATTVGHGDHGSIGFVILASYVALGAAAIHVVIRLLRRVRIGR